MAGRTTLIYDSGVRRASKGARFLSTPPPSSVRIKATIVGRPTTEDFTKLSWLPASSSRGRLEWRDGEIRRAGREEQLGVAKADHAEA